MTQADSPAPAVIGVDADVYERVVVAASSAGVSASAWLTAAARRALLIEDGLAGVAEWEAENGAFTAEEMAEAHERVALRPRLCGR